MNELSSRHIFDGCYGQPLAFFPIAGGDIFELSNICNDLKVLANSHLDPSNNLSVAVFQKQFNPNASIF